MNNGLTTLEPGVYRNEKTGEIVDIPSKMIEIKDGMSIITNENQEKIKNRKNKRRIYKQINETFGDFIFFKVQYDVGVLKSLNVSERNIPRVFMLSTYADENGFLYDNDVPITKADMMRILSLSKNTCYKMVKDLEDADIIENVDGLYKLSKDIFIRGSLPKIKDGERYIKIFINSIRNIYDQLQLNKISDYKSFAIGIQLLQFMSPGSMFLKKPNGSLLRVRDVLKLIGVTDEKYWRQINYVRNLKLDNGEQMIKFVSASFKKKDALNAIFVLNPKIFYIGDAEEMFQICKKFDQLKGI